MKICSVEDCTGKVYAKGYCIRHYHRHLKYGNAEEPFRQSTAKTLTGKLTEGTPKDLSETECWEWTKYRSGGYGRIPYEDKLVLAHRVAYESANGTEVPKGLVIRHKCDNPPCVNPNHLELGTHADNTRDKMERGRARSGNAKLTADEVLRIRDLYAGGSTSTDLVQEFGVSPTTMYRVLHRRTWTRI